MECKQKLIEVNGEERLYLGEVYFSLEYCDRLYIRAVICYLWRDGIGFRKANPLGR